MQTYFAKSIFVSKTFWVNVALIVIALSQDTEAMKLLPAVVKSNLLTIAAVVNVILRYTAKRPVAVIPPGDVQPVAVKSI